MHPLPLMRRPRSSYSHRLSWPIFWLIFLEPSLSPGPCLPACRTHTCRPPAPYCHITECCQQKCCHITECVQSDKPVGGGKSHRVHFERASSSKIELAAFFTQVLATPRSASRRAARGTMDRTQSDWPGGRDTKEYLGHKKKVHSLAWNCSGEKLASGSVDQSVRSYPFSCLIWPWRLDGGVPSYTKCPGCRGALPTVPATSSARRFAFGPSTRRAARRALSSRATRTPWTSCGGTRSSRRCLGRPRPTRPCAYGTRAPASAPTRSRPRARTSTSDGVPTGSTSRWRPHPHPHPHPTSNPVTLALTLTLL